MSLPRPTVLIIDPDELTILDRTVGTSWRADQDVTGHSLLVAVAEHAREAVAQGIQHAYLHGPHTSTHRDVHGWTWLMHAERDGRTDRVRIDAVPRGTPSIYQVRIHSAHSEPLPLLTTHRRSYAEREARRFNAGQLGETGLQAVVEQLH